MIKAEDYIVDNSSTIDYNANVTYRAMNTISFGPGFSVVPSSYGNNFTAEIGASDCDGSNNYSRISSNNLQNDNDGATNNNQNSYLQNPISYTNVTIAPNPFSQSTILEFDIIKAETNVQIALYNMMGQQVKEIANHQTLTEGTHQYDITRENLPSGIYQLQLKTDNGIINKQVVIQ